MSAMRRSEAQSPPPMTLPARADGQRDVMLGVVRGVEEGVAPGAGDDLGAGLEEL